MTSRLISRQGLELERHFFLIEVEAERLRSEARAGSTHVSVRRSVTTFLGFLAVAISGLVHRV